MSLILSFLILSHLIIFFLFEKWYEHFSCVPLFEIHVGTYTYLPVSAVIN